MTIEIKGKIIGPGVAGDKIKFQILTERGWCHGEGVVDVETGKLVSEDIMEKLGSPDIVAAAMGLSTKEIIVIIKE